MPRPQPYRDKLFLIIPVPKQRKVSVRSARGFCNDGSEETNQSFENRSQRTALSASPSHCLVTESHNRPFQSEITDVNGDERGFLIQHPLEGQPIWNKWNSYSKERHSRALSVRYLCCQDTFGSNFIAFLKRKKNLYRGSSMCKMLLPGF